MTLRDLEFEEKWGLRFVKLIKIHLIKDSSFEISLRFHGHCKLRAYTAVGPTQFTPDATKQSCLCRVWRAGGVN